MKQTIWFRSLCLGLAAILAVFAGAQIFVQLTRPAFRTADFFANKRPLPVELDTTPPTYILADWIALDGEVLSDLATLKSRQALEAPPFNPTERTTINSSAQSAALSSLSIAPMAPLTWLMLAQLKVQSSEPATEALRMSYLTGPISPDAIASRIRTVVSTSAVTDEDIRLLAQTDVRSLLTRYRGMEPALAASYRQGTADGKSFLLGAIQAVDPKFSQLIRQ